MARRQIAGARTIITGASSGIGRELARELARQGAHLVITARREERLAEVAELTNSDPGEVYCLAGDITDRGFRQSLLQTAEDQLGGLDILINNAGITGIGPFVEADEQRLRKIMEVNFFVPLETIRAAIPVLQKGNRPVIVNIGSVLGHRAVPNKSEYCASKFAIHGFSDALRAELAPHGIDVLLVSPSTTESEIFDSAMGDSSQAAWSQRGAMSAATVARLTVRAIRQGRHEVILSAGGKLLVWLDRLSPPIMNRLIARFA